MKVKMLSAAMLMLFSALCHASDPVSLQVTGNIIASPCQISSESVNKAVDLGQEIQLSDLQTAGGASPWVNFTLDVDSCPQGTTKVTMTMHGTADATNPADMYVSTGVAENVAVQVQSQAGDALGDGKSITGNIASSAYSFPLRARVYSENGDATAGSVKTTITATFVYQ
ncbi:MULTISPECIES: fimbrial protein [Lelliottia]|uniref:Fimbrial protein n=1 Tax=Lelliottia wanjuensis TaxID=3050585 RepID=A0AAP4D555_9ENTR|nr:MULTISPECIES: fimbrial protein [unclassified Lelliottia]MDK9357490.1 fimbrial protein [Lelliottia sp. V106_16]MDK9364559.1 fimbrial protein [Lelliottia sp. V106_12]MDK9373018.1 fimbrial protein [Lelliottia sp. V106_10]MDK9586443.1 fimbrial protein [Lelliottia sp. V86_10]MDK9599822.1 fimbrial protein [Lelliottia sp. V106_5]